MTRESAPVRMLLVSQNISTIEFLCRETQQLSMHVEISCNGDSAIKKLCKAKFEGVIVDLELGDDALGVLAALRGLTSNSRAISFAIGTDDSQSKTPEIATNFVLHRPLCSADVKRILRASYALMFRERRRDYRYPIEVKTFIKSGSDPEFSGSSLNISETGIAITAAKALIVGARIRLHFDLPKMPEHMTLSADVCWVDTSGRAGLRFVNVPAAVSERLQLWLAERMSELVPVC